MTSGIADADRMRAYFDSDAVIRATEGVDAVAGSLVAILELAEAAGRVSVITSVLTIAETLVGPLKRLNERGVDDDAERLVTIYASLIERHTAIETIEVGIGILFNSASLRATHGALKLPDAIHLASALSGQAKVFVSGDRQLRSIASRHMSVCSLDTADLDALLARIAPAP